MVESFFRYACLIGGGYLLAGWRGAVAVPLIGVVVAAVLFDAARAVRR
jgi:hypothetical protein